MKTILYDSVITFSNIEDSYSVIRKNTEHREKLLRFELFYFSNLKSIQFLLENKSYTHGSYHIFLIREPKYRLIMSESLSDKIVNHLVSKFVLQPLIYPILISTNVATRKEKGSSCAIQYFKYYVNQVKFKWPRVYVLKCDISKYFYNIDHEILLSMLQPLVKDKDLFALLTNIVTSTNQVDVNLQIDKIIQNEIFRLKRSTTYDKNRVLDLSLLPKYQYGKGLPIGNMSSQILALLYLNGLDHYIKEQLHISHYIRYMDDFILFHSDKNYLKYCLGKIEHYLGTIKLHLNKKTQILDLNHGVNFLGYRFLLKDKKLLLFPISRNKRKIRKKLKRYYCQKSSKYSLSKASYKGYFSVSNLYYYRQMIDKIEK